MGWLGRGMGEDGGVEYLNMYRCSGQAQNMYGFTLS